MWLNTSNKGMVAAFHADGYRGKDCVFCVLDTAIADINPRIVHMDKYRINEDNTSEHGTWVAAKLLEMAPDAMVYAYCIFPNNVGKTNLIIAALKDVLNKARANPSKQYFVNMSMSATFGSNNVGIAYSTIHSLIKELNKCRVPVVVAAGNDGKENLFIYPSRWEEPICVGALHNSGHYANFSTWHDEVDFSEYGVDVRSLGNNGKECVMSGTSMACPQVCAKAALLACKIKAVTGKWATEMQLYEELQKCCVSLGHAGFDKHYGYGFVDLMKGSSTFGDMNNDENPIPLKDKIKGCLQNFAGFLINRPIVQNASVDFTRNLKFGMSGEDVKAMKDHLVELGYLAVSTKLSFGIDTQSAVKEFQKDHALKVTGIVALEDWKAIFSEQGKPIPFFGTLRVGSSGSDVLAAKRRLLALNYLTACTHNRFGTDTEKAVKEMQKRNGLESNGTINQSTWAKLFAEDCKPNEIDADSIPLNISTAKAKKIAADLAKVSARRKELVMAFLPYVVDPDNRPKYMLGFYGRGKNLYNKDKSLNVATKSKMNSYFGNSSYAPYYDGGRQEIMESAASESNYTIPWADCSGADVGCLVKAGIVSSGFDANANTLFSRYCVEIAASDAKPGDMMWKDGHAGMYVGGGYVAESVGGEYGMALSDVGNRKVWSFLKKRMCSMGAWQAYGRWVWLKND